MDTPHPEIPIGPDEWLFLVSLPGPSLPPAPVQPTDPLLPLARLAAAQLVALSLQDPGATLYARLTPAGEALSRWLNSQPPQD